MASLQLAASDDVDRISALPDDLLFLILVRLPCVRYAARTSLLSRRWRGLWRRLPKLTFRHVTFSNLETALARVVSHPPAPAKSLMSRWWRGLRTRLPAVIMHDVAVRSLDIRAETIFPRKPKRRGWRRRSNLLPNSSAGANLLLRAAARLSPEELVLTLPSGSIRRPIEVDLPCFDRATSIELNSTLFNLRAPTLAGEPFPALTTLSLTAWIVDLSALLPRCPCLRVLRLNIFWGCDDGFTVHSTTLQELVVRSTCLETSHVDIVAPMLEELIMSFFVTGTELSLSILAPMVKRVSWQCNYGRGDEIGFGLWDLTEVSLRTPDTLTVRADINWVDDLPNYAPYFEREVEKHLLVSDFSVLELHLIPLGHVYGALVVHLLGVNRICGAIQRFKVVLVRPRVYMSEEKDECQADCRCQPTNWRTQTISLRRLEEVEIDGFEGLEDHEFDFVKLILRCAPMLKTMIVKLSGEVSPGEDACTKMCNILEAYPHVYLSSGMQVPHA